MAMKEKGDYDQMNNFLGLITCITLFFPFGLEAFSDNVRLVFIKVEKKKKKGQSTDQKEKERKKVTC